MTNFYCDVEEKRETDQEFDDRKSREFVIKFFENEFNIKLKNGRKLCIDLLREERSDGGVEVEHGGWKGDFWRDDGYSLLSGFNYRTVNIPQRKEKYWADWCHPNEKKRKRQYLDKNIFVRINFDFSQVIIIRANVIRDDKKMRRSRFMPSNSQKMEDWLCFVKKDVETYNLIDGKYKLV